MKNLGPYGERRALIQELVDMLKAENYKIASEKVLEEKLRGYSNEDLDRILDAFSRFGVSNIFAASLKEAFIFG